MANTYSKEDIDRAYAAGVASAEKLWQSFLVSMLDEGAVKVRCFECQKCGERYKIDPDVVYPRSIPCPACARYRTDAVGLCQKVTRRVTTTQFHLNAMQTAVNNMINLLVTLRTVFQASPAAQGMTIQEAQQLPQYEALMNALRYAEQLKASGWEVNKILTTLPAISATDGLTPLERYDSAQPATCAQ